MKGAVILDIAKGRRLLGYEVGFVAVDGTTLTNPTLAVVLNNDADFVVTRMMLVQFGDKNCTVRMPATVTAQIRDSATGNVMFRQSGNFEALGAVPATPNNVMDPRRIMNPKSLPAPYLMRRGSSAFVEINNPAAETWTGDLYVGFEGFYVYPSSTGEDNDPIASQIKGYSLPFNWNGTLAVPANATAAVQNLGTISMLGPGQGHFILKSATMRCAAPANAPAGSDPSDFIGVDIWDTRENSKHWNHVTQPPALGQFMPMSFLTVGAVGAPWAHPRYLGGTDKIFATLYGDPTAWAGNTPGTIELDLEGLWVIG